MSDAVDQIRPPGLDFFLEGEPTDQFLRVNFDHDNLTPEDIVEFGIFMVSLIALEGEQESLMPTRQDVDELAIAGYGMGRTRFDREYGGMGKLQRNLGFFSKNHLVEHVDLIERFYWLANDVAPRSSLAEQETFRGVVGWASRRNLSPSISTTEAVLKGNRREVNELFEVGWKSEDCSYRDLMRLGARILTENLKPVGKEVLNKRYGDVMSNGTVGVITRKIGTIAEFWKEFGLVQNVKGLSVDDLIDMGVQRMVANEEEVLSVGLVKQLAKERRFMTMDSIRSNFGDLETFRSAAGERFEQYKELRSEVLQQGVDPELFKVITGQYREDERFKQLIIDNVDSLKRISDVRSGATDSFIAVKERVDFLVKILRDGFNPMDDYIYRVQLKDFFAALKNCGVVGVPATRFYLDIAPFVDADEALAVRRELQGDLSVLAS